MWNRIKQEFGVAYPRYNLQDVPELGKVPGCEDINLRGSQGVEMSLGSVRFTCNQCFFICFSPTQKFGH